MSAWYGIEGTTYLSKSSVIDDPAALVAIRDSYQLIEDDDDCVSLYDEDENVCRFEFHFHNGERSYGNAGQIESLVSALEPHLVTATRVIGVNEDQPFDDVLGDTDDAVDVAIDSGLEQAQRALGSIERAGELRQATQYANRECAAAVSNLIGILQMNLDLLGEGHRLLIEEQLQRVKRNRRRVGGDAGSEPGKAS